MFDLDKNEFVLLHERNSQIPRDVKFNDLTDVQQKFLWSGILTNLRVRQGIMESKGYDEQTIKAMHKEYLAKYGICLKEDEVL